MHHFPCLGLGYVQNTGLRSVQPNNEKQFVGANYFCSAFLFFITLPVLVDSLNRINRTNTIYEKHYVPVNTLSINKTLPALLINYQE